MTDIETESKRQLLTGEANFLGWKKVMKASLTRKGFYKDANFVAEYNSQSCDFILCHLTLSIAGDIPDDEGPETMWNWLESRFGDDNRWDLEREFQSLKMVSIQPKPFIALNDRFIARIKAAGGKIPYGTQFETLLNGVHQEFYTDYIREMREKYSKQDITSDVMNKCRERLKDFYKATPAATRVKYDTAKLKYEANNADGRKLKRHCLICQEKGLTQYMSTHDTKYHKDDWKPKNLEKGNNKELSSYFLDSGANAHFFKDAPYNCKPAMGTVMTAGGRTEQIIATGEFKLGNLRITKVHHVPSFAKNLVSVTELLHDGHSIAIDKTSFKVFKNGTLVAHGKVCPDTNLLKFSEENDNKMVFEATNEETKLEIHPTLAHDRFAHVNREMIKRTIENNPKAPKILGNINFCKCESCLLAKTRRGNYPKERHEKPDVLEVIAADIQGPFPLEDIEGNRWNLKVIDISSGYARLYTMPDKASTTVCANIKSFITQMERRTGKRVKFIETDRGREFEGACLNYFKEIGVTLRRGDTLDKNFPGKVERLNGTINQMTRALLEHSSLPRKYYGEAMKTAVYVYNRLVHGKESKSPFELVYGSSPRIDKIRKFGSVCYAFIPSEQRDKLAPLRHRCRLLGYGDDDTENQFVGYRLLIENPLSKGKIIHVRDVKFNESQPMLPLEGYSKQNYDDIVSDFVVSEDEEDNYFVDLVPDGNFSTSPESGSIYIPSNESSSTKEPPSEEYRDEDEVFSDSEDERQGKVFQELNDKYSYLWEANNSIDISKKRFLECLIAVVDSTIPRTYAEAISCKDADKWIKAMDKEMASIKRAQTYTIVRPNKAELKKQPVKNRWVYTIKRDKKGKIIRYKARLVAKGFTQKFGIDYVETFAPVAKFKSIRTLAALKALLKLEAYQDDVPTAFLRGSLKELVLMEQIPGYEEGDPTTDLCKLEKTLYGLKQSPREWFKVMRDYLFSQGLIQSNADPCIYYKHGENLYVGVYVDDIITVGKRETVENFRRNLRSHFEITEGGPLEWYLGIAFDTKEDGSVTLDQTQYLKDKLEKYNDIIGKGGASTPIPPNYQKLLVEAEGEEIVSEFPYRQMVGSLMYAMIGTRPDLAVAVSVVSKYLDKPTKTHCDMVKHIFKYIRSNLDVKLHYKPDKDVMLEAYADASYANDANYKSRSGYCTTLGGCLLTWFSGVQPITAQSSAEAEYYGAVSCANEVVWEKTLLKELGFEQGVVTIWEDNQACVALVKNPEDHKRTKHIQVKYHVVREYVENGEVEFKYCSTKDQLGDMFTKGLTGVSLRRNLKQLGLLSQGEN
jgi:hypothetical protein